MYAAMAHNTYHMVKAVRNNQATSNVKAVKAENPLFSLTAIFKKTVSETEVTQTLRG